MAQVDGKPSPYAVAAFAALVSLWMGAAPAVAEPPAQAARTATAGAAPLVDDVRHRRSDGAYSLRVPSGWVALQGPEAGRTSFHPETASTASPFRDNLTVDVGRLGKTQSPAAVLGEAAAFGEKVGRAVQRRDDRISFVIDTTVPAGEGSVQVCSVNALRIIGRSTVTISGMASTARCARMRAIVATAALSFRLGEPATR